MKKLVPTAPLRRSLSIGAVLAMLTLAGGAAAQASPDHTVAINSMSYGAIPSGLKVGDTITWVNHDTVPHTVTARDRSFDLRVNPGKSARMTLQKAGAIPFYCILHSTMRGTLQVAPK